MTTRLRISLTRFARVCFKSLLLLSLGFGILATPPAARAQGGWEPIADGIEYREFLEPGPNRVHVTRMDRANHDVTLETSIANQRLSSGTQTVSRMAEIYDGALSGWSPTWGSRMDVVAAINGSFHDPESGVPLSGMVQGGWYAKRFDDLGGGSGFAWRLDRRAFIGDCVVHPRESQWVTFLDTGRQLRIDGVNAGRRRGTLMLYTHQWGARTPTSNAGTEVLVQMDVPAGILSWPDMATGTIREIHPGLGRAHIPFDHVVLSAAGTTAEVLQRLSQEEGRVGISQHIRHLGEDCEGSNPNSWSETYAALSGSFEFLLDGEIQSFDDPGATTRHPRTAICFNADYLYFVVVDGRDPDRSEGMTTEELGAFCRDRLGARWGINQDGGGSSAMWVDGEIVNRPSDGHERSVANGLMMVTVEAPEQSQSFQPGDRVRASDLIDLSLGPGGNYQTPVDVHGGDTGTILAHKHGLHGILAGGQHWWLIDFNGRVGWAPEGRIELVERSNTPPATNHSESALTLNDLLASFADWDLPSTDLWHHPPRWP